MNLYGMEVVPSLLLTETVTEERRVRGGYLNRWLIRQIVTEMRPSKKVIHDRLSNRIYCHPEILAQIKRELAERSPVFGGVL